MIQTAFDSARAISFSALDNLDQLQPGMPFTVTWAFHNNGESTWGTNYSLVYTDESHSQTIDHPHTPLGASLSIPLNQLGAPDTVEPDSIVYLTLTLTAPDEPGVSVTAWQLESADGTRFGPVRWFRAITVAADKALASFDYRQSSPFSNSFQQYNHMPLSQAFSGNWTFENTGLEAWEGDFLVTFEDAATTETKQAIRDRLGFSSPQTLRELTGRDHVNPGEQVEIRIDLMAPQKAGIYAFHWQLQTAAGVPFGGTRWLQIGVVGVDNSAPPEPVDTLPYTPSGPKIAFFSGIHGPADDSAWGLPGFAHKMQQLDMPIFFMSNGINPDFANYGDPGRNVVRLYWNPEPVSADKAYKYIRDDQLKRWWERGYRRFVFFNEPQLGRPVTRSEEGMGIAWHDADQFGRFLKRCLERARADFPGIFLYTTPMTSNEHFHAQHWRERAWAHVQGLVNGWCMHAYTGIQDDAHAAALNIANQVKQLQRTFQLKIPIIISEASVNRGSNAAYKAQVAHLLPQMLSGVRGVEGVFWYAADWRPEYDTHHEGWFRNGIADAYLQQRVA